MKKGKFLRSLVRTLAVAAFWILFWFAAARLVNKELLLPRPDSVIRRFFEIASSGEFYKVTDISLLRVLLGIVSATVVGVILAVLSKLSSVLSALMSPIVTVIKATPVASFIILALVWLDRSALPVFISFLIVFPIVLTNIRTGLDQVDPKLLEMAKAFRVRRTNIVKNIYMPSLLPFFSAAMKTSLGLAWKAGIAAEVLAVPALSIGKKLFESKAYLETTDLFAWTLVVILLSLIIELVFEAVIGRFGKERRGEKNA